MSEHRFTVVVHTDADELAARMVLQKIIHGDVVTPEIWDELLSPLDTTGDRDTYISLETLNSQRTR